MNGKEEVRNKIARTILKYKLLSALMIVSFVMITIDVGIVLGCIFEVKSSVAASVWIVLALSALFFILQFVLPYVYFRKIGSRRTEGFTPYVYDYASDGVALNSAEDIDALKHLDKYDFGYYGRCKSDRDYRLCVFMLPEYGSDAADALEKEAEKVIRKDGNSSRYAAARINFFVIGNWSDEAEKEARVNASKYMSPSGLVILNVFIDLRGGRILIPECVFDMYGALEKYLCCVDTAFNFLFADGRR